MSLCSGKEADTMSGLITDWLKRDLNIDISTRDGEFPKQFSNGVLFGEIFLKKKLLSYADWRIMKNTDLYENKLSNFRLLVPPLQRVGIYLSIRDMRSILDGDTAILTNIAYEIFYKLQQPYSNIRFHHRKNGKKQDQNKQSRKVKQNAVDDAESTLGALSMKSQRELNGREIIEKLNISAEFNELMLHNTEVDELGRRVEEQSEEQNTFEQIQKFEENLSKFQSVTTHIDSTVETPIEPGGVSPADYVRSLASRHREQVQLREQRQTLRKKLYVRLTDKSVEKSRHEHEQEILTAALKPTSSELILINRLGEIKSLRAVIVNNKIERNERLKALEQAHHEHTQLRNMHLLEQKRVDYIEKLSKEKQVHSQLVNEARNNIQKNDNMMAGNIVHFALDKALLMAEFKKFSGQRTVPEEQTEQWKYLFIKGHSLMDESKVETFSEIENNRTAICRKYTEEYMENLNHWAVKDSVNRRKGSITPCKVIGQVLRTILHCAHPLSPAKEKLLKTRFDFLAAIVGKRFSGKSSCLQLMADGQKTFPVIVQDLIDDALKAYERELEEQKYNEICHSPDLSAFKEKISLSLDVLDSSTGGVDHDRTALSNSNLEGLSDTQLCADVESFRDFGDHSVYFETGHGFQATQTMGVPSHCSTVHSKSSENSDRSEVPGSSMKFSSLNTENLQQASISTYSTSIAEPFSETAKLGRGAMEQLANGDAISDDVVVKLLLNRLNELPDGSICLIEGAPTDVNQALLIEETFGGKIYDSDDDIEEQLVVVRKPPRKTAGKQSAEKKYGMREKVSPDNEIGETKCSITSTDSRGSCENLSVRIKPFRRSTIVPTSVYSEKSAHTESVMSKLIELHAEDDELYRRHQTEMLTLYDQKHPNLSFERNPSDLDAVDSTLLAGCFASYNERMVALLELYGEKYGAFERIDASGSVEHVKNRIEGIIEQNRRNMEIIKIKSRDLQRRIDYADKYLFSDQCLESNQQLEEVRALDTPHQHTGKRKKNSSPLSENAEKTASAVKGGKKDVKQQKVESNTSAPKPPPLPAAGEFAYYFVEKDLPKEIAKFLASAWQNLEIAYKNGVAQCIDHQLAMKSLVFQDMSDIRDQFNSLMEKPSVTQSLVDRFVMDYNRMDDILRIDEEIKCDLHLQVGMLAETIVQESDQNRLELERFRFTAMTDGLLDDKFTMMYNDWVFLMVIEIYRSQLTFMLLETYYISLWTGVIPDKDGDVYNYRQALADMHDRSIKREVQGEASSSRGRSAHFGRNAASSQSVRVRYHVHDLDRSVPLTTTPLNACLNFTPGKDQAKELTHSFAVQLETALKGLVTALGRVRDVTDKNVRSSVHLTEVREKSTSRKTLKGASAETKDAKNCFDLNESIIKQQAEKQLAQKIVSEYLAASKEEFSRCQLRLQLIFRRASADMNLLLEWRIEYFQHLWSILYAEQNEKTGCVSILVNYLLHHIEDEQPIMNRLIVNTQKITLDQNVSAHSLKALVDPLPHRDHLDSTMFSIEQVLLLQQYMQSMFVDDFISAWDVNSVLQWYIPSAYGSQNLPEYWLLLRTDQVESFYNHLTAASETLCWRSFVISLLHNLSAPTREDITQTFSMLKSNSISITHEVTADQAVEFLHWIHNAKLRRALLQIISQGDGGVSLRKLLLYACCRVADPIERLMCALTVLQGFADDEDDINDNLYLSTYSDSQFMNHCGLVEKSGIQELTFDRAHCDREKVALDDECRVDHCSAQDNSSEHETTDEGNQNSSKQTHLECPASDHGWGGSFTDSESEYDYISVSNSSLYNQVTLNSVLQLIKHTVSFPSSTRSEHLNKFKYILASVYKDLTGEPIEAIVEALYRGIPLLIALEDILSNNSIREIFEAPNCILHYFEPFRYLASVNAFGKSTSHHKCF